MKQLYKNVYEVDFAELDDIQRLQLAEKATEAGRCVRDLAAFFADGNLVLLTNSPMYKLIFEMVRFLVNKKGTTEELIDLSPESLHENINFISDSLMECGHSIRTKGKSFVLDM